MKNLFMCTRMDMKLLVLLAQIPAASDSIRVKFDGRVGRHVIAARDISVGEVVFVERPIVSTICDEHYENICLGEEYNVPRTISL